MWEAEIGKFAVPGQLGYKKFTRPHLSGIKLDMVVYICLPSNGQKHKVGGSQSRLASQKVRHYHQNNQSKKGLKTWVKQ
jgi:hypothetical protein